MIRIFYILLISVLSCSAAEVPLDESLPYTDAAWFWTYNDYKLPIFNRNLSGKYITIGGEKFNHGICGHTCFSMVYNINDTAKGFQTLAGIEDKDDPRDIARKDTIVPTIIIVILADREEVFRREVKLGEPPVPVRVDLRGRSQLEIRAETGKGNTSHRFRPVFGNPLFITPNPTALKDALTKERQKRDTAFAVKIKYPSAPSWKNIRIEKIKWQGYENCYRVNNGRIEAIFTPECGGRILFFSGTDGNNLLLKNQSRNTAYDYLRGRTGDFAGGHFMRLLPRNYFTPAEPLLEHFPFEISFPSEGVISMRSQSSPVMLVSYEYRFEIKPGKAGIEISNVVTNTAPFARRLGVWSVTRLENTNLNSISMPAPEKIIQSVNEKGAADLKKQKETFFFRLNNKFSPDMLLEFICWSNPMKLLAEFNNGKKLEIRYSELEKNAGIIHVYAAKNLAELEGHGEISMMQPGESCVMKEEWMLID